MATNKFRTSADERALIRKIDAVGWGLVLVWVGLALLAHLGWGAGLIGVGLITLGEQAWRKTLHVQVDRFGLVLGTLLGITGLWNLVELPFDLVPILFIAAGLGLLASTWRPRHGTGGRTGIGAPPHPRT